MSSIRLENFTWVLNIWSSTAIEGLFQQQDYPSVLLMVKFMFPATLKDIVASHNELDQQ